MTAAPGPIGMLWVGTELRWLDRLALHSFAQRGHPVTLFHTHDLADPGIEGVTLRPARDVFEGHEGLLEQVSPAVYADFFRLHLMQKTDMIWADTDCLSLRPLAPAQGYLLGYESDSTVNNAVMRMPRDSDALRLLLKATGDASFVPPWLKKAQRQILAGLPKGTQLVEAAKLVPTVFGPQALTWALNQTGEIARALHKSALNPVHWSLADIYFNPHGGVAGWITPKTQCLHLYASRIRAVHRRAPPFAGSFIAQFAAEIRFDFAAPLRQI